MRIITLKNSKQKFFFVILAIIFLSPSILLAQKITGTILDKATKTPLIGASVVQKGTTNGTRADFNGKFELKLDPEKEKIVSVSYLGYKTFDVQLGKSNYVDVSLEENIVLSNEVVITSSRLNEKIQESPVTIERMNATAIKETPAIGFYEGLANLKGVDMTSASLGFKVINTRGFNSTSPVRTLQLIDGMDNQAPGLNFALGNFVGASELDVESVDLIVGANSATYGPNAFNGVINITTKDPFKYRGLNVQLKGATRNLFDGSIRYAGVINEKFGYKINASYLIADDFEANSIEPIDQRNSPLPNIKNNLYGYDAINVYGEVGTRGDGNLLKVDGEDDPEIKDQIYIYRDGYREKDLTDNYKTESIKLSGGLYYKFFKENIISYTYNFGTGTTIYQGENRYSIKNILFQQHKAEIKGERYFLKAYTTLEDAGDSYDLVFSAFKLLENAKSNSEWFSDFGRGYDDARFNQGKNVDDALIYARQYANGQGFNPSTSIHPKYQPGTPEFKEALDKIRTNPSFKNDGTRFQDVSALRHYEGQYNFDLSKYNKLLPEVFKVGTSYRQYLPQSFGTIFSDTLIDRNDESKGFTKIEVFEIGYYASAEKKLFKERLNLIGSLRVDDHKNFKPTISPAISAVVSVNKTDRLRLTYTTAVRNPTLQDQFLYYDIGLAILSGNINGKTVILRRDYPNYIQDPNQQIENFLTYVPGVKPESVKTIEAGYKGILGKKVYVDMSYYYSIYKDFIGYVIGFAPDPKRPEDKTYRKAFRLSTNARDLVTTQGYSIGLNYYFMKKYSLGGNYTYSILNNRDSSDPLIPNYNTPPHKYNISFGGRDIKHFGFNVTYKWVHGFDYTGSPQFTGFVPEYGLVDAQVNYKYVPFNTTFKVGASNILNNKHFEAYGAPSIGILGYASITFEL